MSVARESFVERCAEIDEFTDFLRLNEVPTQSLKLTVMQLSVMKSAVFLQLYNLVESSISLCCQDLASAIDTDKSVRIQDLSEKIRKEWLKVVGQTGKQLNPEKRHELFQELIAHAISGRPVDAFSILDSGGGNWDNLAINKLCKRVGIEIEVSEPLSRLLNIEYINEDGPVVSVRVLRNDLAHGNKSFSEVGQVKTVSDIIELSNTTQTYLEQVISGFEEYIINRQYAI